MHCIVSKPATISAVHFCIEIKILVREELETTSCFIFEGIEQQTDQILLL